MKKIKLLTESGGYVTSAFIPPFNTPPQAVVWGQRIFFFKSDEEYREGFCVAAVIYGNEVDEIETGIAKWVKGPAKNKDAGNDDLHFGIPKDLDEAAETFLEFYRTAKDMNEIVDMSEDEFRGFAHHGAGMFMRNSWYLWWHEGHGYDSWPKTKPALVAWFNERGIYHADDISSIIITSAYRKVNNKPIDLEKQIQHYINYWKQQGFKDGNPMKKKG